MRFGRRRGNCTERMRNIGTVAAREIEAEETASPTVKRSPRGPPGGARQILAATRDNARKSRRHRAEATVRVSRRGSDVLISLSMDRNACEPGARLVGHINLTERSSATAH
jgi:hypothetical protein